MEDALLLIARLALAAVFLVAGGAKLVDWRGSRQAMLGFGVPERLAGPVGWAVPIAEIAVGVLLIPLATAWWAALGGLLLLLGFIGAIAYNLARGRTPDCHCFGQLHSAPIGVPTLIRNGVLALVAAFILIWGWNDAGTSLVGWLDDLSAAEGVALGIAVLALAVAAAEGWLLVHLLGQNGRLLIRLDEIEQQVVAGGIAPAHGAGNVPPAAPLPGLPVGAPAPGFSLTGLFGETMTLDALRAQGKSVLLVSSDPGCGPCNALLPDIGTWQREHAGKLTVALISRGTPAANKAKVSEHGIAYVLLQKDREVAQAYQAHGTPAAWIVNADGTVGSPLAQGAEGIRQLVARTTGQPAPTPPRPSVPVQAAAGNGAAQPAAQAPARSAPPPPPPSRIGEAAPEVKLNDLDGKEVALADYKGGKTMLLFWNPGCGFCKRMVEDLKGWEASPPAGSPKLLVVSTGGVEANREHGFSSTIVLDEGFQTGRSFGASGTPSSILIDEEGKIASRVAVGGPGVLAMARGEETPAPVPAAGGNGAPAPVLPKVGDPAPEVRLPDLTGKSVNLAQHKGTKTLVLFWNPGCGFCKRMLDDLKAWEAKPPRGAPKLLVVSTGSVEDNQAEGLRSPILLDQGFRVGNTFGAGGTPSAVLIDAKGNIASEVAVGAQAVMALAGAKPAEPKVINA